MRRQLERLREDLERCRPEPAMMTDRERAARVAELLLRSHARGAPMSERYVEGLRRVAAGQSDDAEVAAFLEACRRLRHQG
jgi:hypothetical protein